MTFSFHPLSLSEAHRRRATLLAFSVQGAPHSGAEYTENEEDEEVTAP